MDLLFRLVTPTGTKECARHVALATPFVPVGVTNRNKIPTGTKDCSGCQTRDKRAPLLSRPGVPSWKTGTTGVFQPGQISVSVVVDFF